MTSHISDDRSNPLTFHASSETPESAAQKAQTPTKSKGLMDTLVRKMPVAFLFDTPVPTRWESMLRRTSSDASTISRSSPRTPSTPGSPAAGFAHRWAALMAFESHPEAAYDMGRAAMQDDEKP